MITIRKNVFETNSSSMHTLAISNNPKKFTKEDLTEDDIIEFEGKKYIKVCYDQFYRNFNMLDTFMIKLPYVIQWACQYDGSSRGINKDPKNTESYVDLITDLIKEKLEVDGICSVDNEEIFVDEENCAAEEHPFGTVSDQFDVLENGIELLKIKEKFETAKDLFEYILFSDEFIIVTDSDEVCEFEEIVENGCLNNSIKYVLYDHYENGRSYYEFKDARTGEVLVTNKREDK